MAKFIAVLLSLFIWAGCGSVQKDLIKKEAVDNNTVKTVSITWHLMTEDGKQGSLPPALVIEDGKIGEATLGDRNGTEKGDFWSVKIGPKIDNDEKIDTSIHIEREVWLGQGLEKRLHTFRTDTKLIFRSGALHQVSQYGEDKLFIKVTIN